MTKPAAPRAKGELVADGYILVDQYDDTIVAQYKTMAAALRAKAKFIPMGADTMRIATIWRERIEP